MTCTGVHPDCMSGGPRCACARARSSDDDQMWSPAIAPAEAKPDPAIGAAVPFVPLQWSWPSSIDIVEELRGDGTARLHPDDIEAIARRVAELLRGAP